MGNLSLTLPAQPFRDAGGTCWGEVSESWEGGAGDKLGVVPGSDAVPSGRKSSTPFPLPGPPGLQEHSSEPLMPWLCSPHVASHYHLKNSYLWPPGPFLPTSPASSTLLSLLSLCVSFGPRAPSEAVPPSTSSSPLLPAQGVPNGKREMI